VPQCGRHRPRSVPPVPRARRDRGATGSAYRRLGVPANSTSSATGGEQKAFRKVRNGLLTCIPEREAAIKTENGICLT
jgi:hypothetical protein